MVRDPIIAKSYSEARRLLIYRHRDEFNNLKEAIKKEFPNAIPSSIRDSARSALMQAHYEEFVSLREETRAKMRRRLG